MREHHDKYPGAILHHHANLYVHFLREHDHDPEEHDEHGRHHGGEYDHFFGPACTDNHDNEADHYDGGTDKHYYSHPRNNPYNHDTTHHEIDDAFD